ncbi:uncharacterized protein LOC120343065 [Styela clava]|uniref:uncharacterized protein LOC120343065 n=1 Tax=Styela clava TaxID=7725 RepID=UPI001939C795|nr:uncharacterized protein LOC120343065 [Styela clava]
MDLDLMAVATETETVLRQCLLLVIRLDTNMKLQKAQTLLREEFAKIQPIPIQFYRYKSALAFFLQHCRELWEDLKQESIKQSENQYANCMLLANNEGQYWIEIERNEVLKSRSLNDNCSTWEDNEWKKACVKFAPIIPEKFPTLLF